MIMLKNFHAVIKKYINFRFSITFTKPRSQLKTLSIYFKTISTTLWHFKKYFTIEKNEVLISICYYNNYANLKRKNFFSTFFFKKFTVSLSFLLLQ